MPDLSVSYGGGRFESAVNAAASQGITVTPSATPHTKGSWTELVAATTFPYTWVMISAGWLNAAAGTASLDIGIGTSTAEQVLIADLCYESIGAAGSILGSSWLLPLAVPVGSRLAARQQASAASNDGRISLVGIAPTLAGPTPLGRVETVGFDAANTRGQNVDPGGSAHTDSGWVELTASTGFAYRWLCLDVQHVGALSASTSWLIDLAVGGSGSEQILVPDLHTVAGTSADATGPNPRCFPCHVAAGQRLSVRARCATNVDTNRDIYVLAHGVG
jgi:hypothetical protein